MYAKTDDTFALTIIYSPLHVYQLHIVGLIPAKLIFTHLDRHMNANYVYIIWQT